MAREEKRFELKPVDDAESTRLENVVRLDDQVIRLERKPGTISAKPQRLEVRPKLQDESLRLDIPDHEPFDTRSHQPGIDALMDLDSPGELTESHWGESSETEKNIPWGWFILIALGIGGAFVWSLTRVTKGEAQVVQIQAAAGEVLQADAREEGEASDLISEIENCTRSFFDGRSIEDLLPYVRHADRVRPLMEHYYSENKMEFHPLSRVKNLTPVTLGNRGNFWIQNIELANREQRNALMEVGADGDVKLDWETLVCYQPMNWDAFALERPTGRSLDFRVYIEEDSFFSHEFADSKRWTCLKLTALGCDETLFGYIPRGHVMEAEAMRILGESRGRPASVILRLSVPERLQSRRGVMVEEILSPRWAYVDPPSSEP